MGSLRDGAVRAKILIWGAPGAGKSTTLKYVETKLKNEQKGTVKKVTLKDPPGNYELLPVELGEVKGVKTQLDLIASPGAWEHASVRRRLLQGVDGVVFCANSVGSAMKENQKSLAELDEGLKSMGRSLVTVPIVFEWMNQKAMGSMPSDEMSAKLNAKIGAPAFSVPAEEMSGILKAFATISKMVVKNVRDEYDQGKLTEPAALEIDLDSLPPKVGAGKPKAAAPPDDSAGVNPFADLASELDEISDEFAVKLDAPGKPKTVPAQTSAAKEDEFNEAELSALLDEPADDPVAAAPKNGTRQNGAAKFKLVSAGEATLSADGTLALPIRIGNEHGEELAMTISVKVTPG